MDVFNTISELARSLSPLLALLLLYFYNKISQNTSRIEKLESKADRSLDSLNKIMLDVEIIKTRVESLTKEFEKH